MRIADWDDLRLFRAVAKAGSFSGAARSEDVSQPTLGRRISALESRLGSTVFVRTPRGLELTRAGSLLLESVEKMADAAGEAEARAIGAIQGPAGTVTISMTESLALGWAVEVLATCRKAHPEIDFDIKVDMAVADLHRRQADIALRMVRPTQSRLIARKIGEMDWGFFASTAYLKQFGVPRRLEDFREHPLVVPDETLARYMQPLTAALAPYADRIAFRSNNGAALLAATRASYGIGFHSLLLAHTAPELTRVLPDLTPARTEIWLVAHEDLHRNAGIRAVFDFLGDRLKADVARFIAPRQVS